MSRETVVIEAKFFSEFRNRLARIVINGDWRKLNEIEYRALRELLGWADGIIDAKNSEQNPNLLDTKKGEGV